MDANTMEIEMNDLQTGEDDIEFPLSKSSSSSRNNGYNGLNYSDENNNSNKDGPAESGSWLRSRIRRQNRCIICALILCIGGAIAYVASGMYMSDEQVNSLVEPFESESGTVTNNAQNGKMQKIIDQSQNSQNRSHIYNNNKENHFGKTTTNPFANKINHAGKQHNGAFGGRPTGGGNGGPMGNPNTLNNNGGGQGKLNGGHGGASTNNKNEKVKGKIRDSQSEQQGDNVVEIDESDVYCEDLLQYSDWIEAKVTKADGPMFTVVKEMDHDPKAFT
jgi:hypothetical protein